MCYRTFDEKHWLNAHFKVCANICFLCEIINDRHPWMSYNSLLSPARFIFAGRYPILFIHLYWLSSSEEDEAIKIVITINIPELLVCVRVREGEKYFTFQRRQQNDFKQQYLCSFKAAELSKCFDRAISSFNAINSPPCDLFKCSLVTWVVIVVLALQKLTRQPKG